MKGYLANRSLRFPDQVAKLLKEMGVDQNSANVIGKNLQDIAKSEKKESSEEKREEAYELDIFKTPQIVFYTPEEVKFCAEAIKSLLGQGLKPKDAVKEIRSKKSKFPTPRSADIALFGRMVTSDNFDDVDAACQVAHAISTNRVSMDMDFYTAIDDLQPKAETGAGMMGTTMFNSSCFYRYSMIDLAQLKENLGEDGELASRTLESFLRASVTAIPTGKQNSMAAQNPPDAIFAVVRGKGAPMSLANAFATPIRSKNERNLVQASVEAMDSYWERLSSVYGEEGVIARPICLVEEVELHALKDQQEPSLGGLIKKVMNTISLEGRK